ncbi:MAG: DUF1343 domain-containing protein [Deltaproteobacteria bacterium]|nr:MAG: DUF1343 domain-containing protein [Deltaproteobacteria bacterium]
MLRPSPTVRTGLDRIADGDVAGLHGRAVGLLAHPASVTRKLRHARDVLRDAGARIVALFGPEHGIDATAQDMVAVGDVATSDVPVYSLYGDDPKSLSPTEEMLEGVEVLVCDLADVGARYYTYAWTCLLAAEVALGAGREVWILDRPNPLGGADETVEGGRIEPGYESFVGLHDVAVRHGMTVGELVAMALAERGRVDPAGLSVVACEGWHRRMTFPQTGVPWVMPSPNMPTFDTATVYPGQCLLEGTNVSEGRGTTRPFEIFGAPFLDGARLLERLDPADFPGLGLRPVAFEPTFQKHAGRRCGGLQLHVLDPVRVRSLRSSIALLRAIRELAGASFAWRTEPYEFVEDRLAIDLLAGGPWLREGLEAGASVVDLVAAMEPARRAFVERRRPFLRYSDAP